MIYIANHDNDTIFAWSNTSVSPIRNLSVSLPDYTSLFVTLNGDIYFENGNEIGRIDKWPTNSTNSVVVANFSGNCYSLFIDIYNNLYCSLKKLHRVERISLDGDSFTKFTVAGSVSQGNAVNELWSPWDIFVDTNSDLYVADRDNHRIQRFRSGQTNGETVAGCGIPNNLTLNRPINVILDGNGFLYVADNNNHRIIRISDDDNYECIIGCTGQSGSAADQLNKPYAIRFDSLGNLYVADEYNHRIQKFELATNSCSKYNHKLKQNTTKTHWIIVRSGKKVYLYLNFLLSLFTS